MDTAYLNKISYYFSQEGNTSGTTSEDEELIVEVEGPVGSIEREGGFLVIRSSTGWSINDADELMEILNLVQKGVPLSKQNENK